MTKSKESTIDPKVQDSRELTKAQFAVQSLSRDNEITILWLHMVEVSSQKITNTDKEKITGQRHTLDWLYAFNYHRGGIVENSFLFQSPMKKDVQK